MKSFLRNAKRPRVWFGIFLGFLTLEVCARIDGYVSYGTPFFSHDSIDTLYTTDALGKHGKANARYRKWKLNSLGYRGPELHSGRQRIICIGASETFGLYEDEDREYPRQLERELNRRLGRDAFDVVNVAYAGLTLNNEVQRLPGIIKTVQPRIALIYPALANYIWNPTEAAHAPVETSTPPPSNFEFRILDNFGALAKNVTPLAVQTWIRQMQIDRQTRRHPAMKRLPEASIERFRSELNLLVRKLQAAGVEPVLVTHATRFGKSVTPENRPYLVAWRKFYPTLAEEGFLDMESRMNAVIRQVASKQKLHLIDIAEELPAESRYFADFAHFTNEGSRVMAGLLADGLQPLISIRKTD